MPTILIIDDAAYNREPLARLLRLSGYSVVCAEGGRQALSALQHMPVDLILLDLMMPEMDGVALLRSLRRDPHLRSIPVVVVTSLRYGDQLEEARALGVRDVLLKADFMLDDLLDVVQRHVGGPPSPAAVADVAAVC
jgi:two-component system sensor histidine kinase/response regulator